jgi:hypothetical protein
LDESVEKTEVNIFQTERKYSGDPKEATERRHCLSLPTLIIAAADDLPNGQLHAAVGRDGGAFQGFE